MAPPVDTAAEAGAAAIRQIEAMERFLGRQIAPIRITYVGRSRFGSPGAENLLVTAPDKTFENGQWVVRAEGTFVTQRGRQQGARAWGSGYFLSSDGDGSILGMGMP